MDQAGVVKGEYYICDLSSSIWLHFAEDLFYSPWIILNPAVKLHFNFIYQLLFKSMCRSDMIFVGTTRSLIDIALPFSKVFSLNGKLQSVVGSGDS